MTNKPQNDPGQIQKFQKQHRHPGIPEKILLALVLISLVGCGILTDREQVEVREPALEKLTRDRYPDFQTPLIFLGF